MSDVVGSWTSGALAARHRRLRTRIAGLTAGVLMLGCAAAWGQNADKAAAPDKAAAKTESKAPAETKSQASYSIGVSMGAQLHSMGMNADSISVERLTQGLKDSLGGKVTPSAQDQQNIQGFIRGAHDAMG